MKAPRAVHCAVMHAGPYMLTASQSLAWHSDESAERDDVRVGIRRRCRERLEVDGNARAVEILDLGGRVLERVERQT